MGATATLTEADFSGWASKAGLRCSDGRTIMPEAFKGQDRATVPLVWQHTHNNPENVLGHAVLEARDEGVYCRGFFNDTPAGQTAKALVQHGDVKSLSIYANQLVEKAKQVFHGVIHEVSLVLSGANPGAMIENIALSHGDGFEPDILDDQAVIYTGLPLENVVVEHAANSNSNNDNKNDNTPTVQDVIDSMTEEQKNVLYFMIGEALNGAGNLQQSAFNDDDGDDEEEDDEEEPNYPGSSPSDVNKDTSPSQRTEIVPDSRKNSQSGNGSDTDNLEHSDKEGTTLMTNVFEADATKAPGAKLTHSQLAEIVEDAKKMGSFKDSFLKHAVEYGIENIDLMFPDAKAISNTPELIARRQEWVNVVMQGTRKTPFSRIKTVSADITHDQARAKGYVKGTLKKEEWFSLAKRVTTPTTIYKKQKLDRDDIIDITDLDVVVFLKGEMRLMLDEEIARAILVGDGREVDDDDKISEANIRPIARDDDFFAHKVVIPANTGSESLIEQMLRSRTKYRGTGTPTLFCTEDLMTDMLLGKDKMGRRYYANQDELKTALRVADIITVDVMEDLTADGGDLLAVMVNLADYTIGADRGGAVSLFDDFDIDYNQYKYLIETRMSGALTKFKSALVFIRSAGTLVAPTVPTFVAATGVLTVPAEDGVAYYNDDTNAVLTAGAQPAIAAGETVTVRAETDETHYFAPNTATTWSFTRDV
jgi:HK97 family phage prohead protease